MPVTLFDKLISSITWTLVHSLWQGLILTVLAGLAVLLTRRSTAAFRYAILCTLFFLFLGSVGFTFFLEWNKETETSTMYTAAEVAGSSPIFSIDYWRSGVASFLNQNAEKIVLVWSLVLFFQSGRMVREIFYIRRLRSSQSTTAGNFWTDKIQVLADELGIKKTVLLVESAVVKIPIVIGHFKPLIMVPVGMMNHLSPNEMEAVLLHELAHIRRHDYLVNYFQRIAETLLFFNPGMLWVSSLLRAEREACCDETAIAYTGNKLQFVEALIRCKEHALKTPAFSLGLFGNPSILMRRLNRIVSDRNKSLSLSEASFFGTSILVLMLFLSSWNQRKQVPVSISTVSITKSDLPLKKVISRITEQKLPTEVNQMVENSKPLPFVTKGKRVLQAKKQQKIEEASVVNIDQQTPVLDKNLHQQEIVVQLVDGLTTEHDAKRKEAESWRAKADQDRMRAEKARYQSEVNRAKAELLRKQADQDREIAAQYWEQAQKDRLRAERERIGMQKFRDHVNRRRQMEIVQ